MKLVINLSENEFNALRKLCEKAKSEDLEFALFGSEKKEGLDALNTIRVEMAQLVESYRCQYYGANEI